MEGRAATATSSEEPHQDTSSKLDDTSGSAASLLDAKSQAAARQARFKALQSRARTSQAKNLKEAAAESQRLAQDPNALSSLARKQDFAAHKLLKAETEANGEDFERKRAWDWTVDETEKWDKRMKKKSRRRGEVAFQDYTQESKKIYKRQLREFKPDMEGYEKEKMAALERAAASGGLEIVETDDGELIAIDKEGTFYSTADSTDFVESKPSKAAIDKLVADLKKAEETRLRKRRERGNEDDPDVTYINEQNKQFNQKLQRFYDKYTTEIRDSFERGTMV
ncbi:MAG: pre-mRNA-splicing factor syf2 [Vezdaea aestivalis]|nr:MAG: pre-mRNA-splicing factor syf2 [Vezdaea aestivalis]